VDEPTRVPPRTPNEIVSAAPNVLRGLALAVRPRLRWWRGPGLLRVVALLRVQRDFRPGRATSSASWARASLAPRREDMQPGVRSGSASADACSEGSGRLPPRELAGRTPAAAALARANRKRFNAGLPPLRQPPRARTCLPTCTETMERLHAQAKLSQRPLPGGGRRGLGDSRTAQRDVELLASPHLGCWQGAGSQVATSVSPIGEDC
jgi:hypothetical protein